ncbi:MAG: S-layer protein [Candidatus Micrarchaeia archaeon]
MKSMRKFATLAVGAMMAASAVAAVSMDSTSLTGYKFFNNGEPAVKVVIGAAAQPQDVVVAANIAAMIGNLAYTDKDVTVVGKDGVSCGAGAGTCAVDDATKKVTLSVTVPGASSSSVYTLKTYINDYLDNQVDTVRAGTSGNVYNGDTSTYAYAKKVTKDLTDVVALPNSGKVDNPRNRDVKQEQFVYLGAKTMYESGTSYKTVVSDKMRASYNLTFSEALPLCWDVSKTILTCPSSDNLTDTHTKIKLLGQDWVIVNVDMASASAVKSIELGKETAYTPYMNVDDEVTAANGAKVALKSIQVTTSTSQAAFEVTSASGTKTVETINNGASKDVAGVTIRVNNVFSGVSGFNYADVSVFSDKVTLSDNVQIDSTTHQYWYASIKSTTIDQTPAISSIALYSSYPYVKSDDKWKAGEKLSLIRGQESFDFTFDGLDDASVTYDNLGFNIQSGDIPTSASGKFTGKFVEVNSGVSNAFQTGTISKNIVRIALTALTGSNASLTTDAPIGTPFIQDTNGFWVQLYGDYNAPKAGDVVYHYSGSEQSVINVTGDTSTAVVAVKEFTEDNMVDAGKYLTFLYDPALGTAGQFADADGSTVTSKAGYAASIGSATPTYETGLITDRGVKFLSIGTTNAAISYPKVPVKAKYTLKTSGTNATAGTVALTLGVGEKGTIDTGYVATVSGIAASASGAAGTSGLTGLDAIAANPTKAAVVSELNTGTNPMVMLDSDAGASSASAVIVVGGPIVNTLAKDQPAQAGDSKVVVQGGKIFVYGWTAADTTAAGNELISWLAQNRATIRG